MRCKQIAAMGMVGVLLGAGSLLATTGGASATVASTKRRRAEGAAPRRSTTAWPAWANGRPAERRPEDRGGRVHVARRHRLAHPGDAPRRRAPHVQRTSRDRGPLRRRVVGAARRATTRVSVSPDHHTITFRFENYGAIDGLNFRTLCAPSIAFTFLSDGQLAGAEQGDDRDAAARTPPPTRSRSPGAEPAATGMRGPPVAWRLPLGGLHARALGFAQRRDHRPRRPRQDHAGRRPALAVRRVPRQPGRQRAGHGLERPRAREGHHDPRQEHGGPLRRRDPQHRRHARSRRLRRRGRARARDGRRCAAARRRERGPAPADALRAAQDARGAPSRDPRGQQGRPARRAHRGGRRRGVRALHRSRRRRAPDRVPDRLHERACRLGVARPRRRGQRPQAAVRARSSSASPRRSTTKGTRSRRS